VGREDDVTETDQRESGRSGGRRAAILWLTRGFLSLWAVGAAALGIGFLKAPSRERRPGEGHVDAGTLSSLPIGGSRFIRHGARPLFVVRVSETEVVALSAICTHLHCVLRWDDGGGRLLCPCHNGSFDRTGNVLAGPATRPLPQYRVEIRDDAIRVRT
jgi:cytochrome b6-f complex iron-sulfur subunit